MQNLIRFLFSVFRFLSRRSQTKTDLFSDFRFPLSGAGSSREKWCRRRRVAVQKARLIKLAVVMEVVHAHFETVLRQFFALFTRNRVVAFGNKIERGTEAEFLFQLHQLRAFRQPIRSFNVVGEHESEFLAIRPAGPAGGRMSRGFIDGPDILAHLALAARNNPAQRHPETPGQIRLEMIIELVGGQGILQIRN